MFASSEHAEAGAPIVYNLSPSLSSFALKRQMMAPLYFYHVLWNVWYSIAEQANSVAFAFKAADMDRCQGEWSLFH